MAEVFVSYKREERGAVERIATTLRGLGISVWFDASMSAGEAFSDEIDREAHGAKAILVCWSPNARDSQWVKSEALIGFEKSKLAACYVAGPDGFYPPTPFNSIHAEDLRAWLAAPSDTHSGWKSILRRVGKLCGRPDIESYGALDVQASAAELNAWIGAHGSSPLFMSVEALLRAREAEETERGRLEQEARERHAREEAARRAREEAARRQQEERDAEARALRELERRRALEAERAREEAEAHRQRDRDRDQARGQRWVWPVGAAVLALIVVMVWAPWRSGPPESSPVSTEIFAAVESVRDCAECPEMVAIPAGSFTMGSPEGEPGRESDEGPQRTVSVRAFAASIYEITFAQWDACVAGGGCGGYRPADQGWGRGSRPVINVSWNDAQAYITWINSRVSGGRYRLLSEAEWEYAARAGTTSAYSTGSSISASQARFSPSSSTAEVGSYPANRFGLHDMHGNVWEWTQDCYASSYHGLSTDGSANETSYADRVFRGGSWNYDPTGLRSAGRIRVNPTYRYDYLGFRLARTVFTP